MYTAYKKGAMLLLVLTLLAGALFLVGCNNSGTPESGDSSSFTLLQEGKLTVGSDCDYPPFIQLNTEGQPEGFEYDMMLAIAEEMGLELNYLPPQNFDTIIPQIVGGGKMDVGVSSFTITPERQEEVDFSDPYFDAGVNQAITIPNDSSITSKDQLSDKKVGVQAGTTGEAWVKENIPGAEIVPFTTITDAFNAMLAGKVDACVNDLPAAEGLITKSFSTVKVLESVPTAEEYGIVVSKDNPNLTAAINEALATIKANGTLEEITNRWITEQ